jgi:hypothetical protein
MLALLNVDQLGPERIISCREMNAVFPITSAGVGMSVKSL